MSEGANQEYYKVPNDIYRVSEKVERDLFFYYARNYVLFKSKDTVWTVQDSDRLKNTDVQVLYVRCGSSTDHHAFLHEKLSAILSKPNIPIARKARVLYEIADPVLSSVFKTPSSAELMASSVTYVKDCIQYLNERGGLPELVKLSSDSLTEHEHALHVSAYSIALSKKMGFRDMSEIFALGMGAILHDIGKSQIPQEIIMKPTELDNLEWQTMRMHPIMGDQVLERRQVVPLLSRRIVLEHHERVNGKGYPKGIKNPHIFSRMVSIADCFNSLTSSRIYRKNPMPPYEALKFMLTTMKQEFDINLLENFIQMLSE